MSNFDILLKSILGDKGLETLKKGIYKQDSQSSLETIDTFLPLLVVPRSILSWLIQNIQPMEVNSVKSLKFPGKEDINIEIQKIGRDAYRADFIQKGKIIHSFDKQSLPNIGGHLMTVGEMYDSFVESAESKDKMEGFETPNLIMDIANEQEAHTNHGDDTEKFKWEMAHANVRELSGVIGKLVDALVANNIIREGLKQVINQSKDELEKQTASETAASSIRSAFGGTQQASPPPPPPPPPPPAPSGGTGDLGADISRGLNTMMGKSGLDEAEKEPSKQSPKNHRLITHADLRSWYNNKKRNSEVLQKPYASEAQRRWAHTASGKEALGGEAAVRHWDKETKGKDLPERTAKDEINPNQKLRDFYTQHKAKSDAAASKDSAPRHLHTFFEDGEAEGIQPLHVVMATRPEHGSLIGMHHHLSPEEHKTINDPNPEKWHHAIHSVIEDAFNKGFDRVVLHAPAAEGAKKQVAHLSVIKKDPIETAQKPSGSAVPNQPKIPKPDVTPSKNPIAAMGKQGQVHLKQNNAPKASMEAAQHKQPAKNYFRDKLKPKQTVLKNEHEYHVTEKNINTKCIHCGISEFEKKEDGSIKYKPCACFAVTLKSDSGKNIPFVEIIKKSDSSGYVLKFNPKADKDVIEAFLVTIKSRLLKFKNQ